MSDINEIKDTITEFKGNGYVLLYKFDEEFIKKDTFLPEILKDNYYGGLGAVIYIDYTHSDIGNYQELLFIPGKFVFNGHKKHIVSKAYVSSSEVQMRSMNSMTPKELATFTKQKLDNDIENVTVMVDGNTVISLELRARGIKFPLSTSLLSFSIMDIKDDKVVETDCEGQGTAMLTKLESLEIRPALFPDFAQFIPLSIVKLEDFSLQFNEHISRIE